jgi:predicted amidophosphoribosyltransferase
MNCPACHLVHPEGARFCLNCGGALATTCPHCGTTLVPGAQFCHNYGYALATPQSPTVH